jgi:virginiamycin B lyase
MAPSGRRFTSRPLIAIAATGELVLDARRERHMRALRLSVLLVLLLALPAASAQAVCATPFSNGISPNAGLGTGVITAGPDGNVWFTERAQNRIGRIAPAGRVTEFAAGNVGLGDITAGPDGNLWFTDDKRIGRITPSGSVTEFGAGITNPVAGITAGPDGNLWFTEADRIGRITPSGSVTEFAAGIRLAASPGAITAGPDGNLWFIEQGIEPDTEHGFQGISGAIGRITPSGQVTEFLDRIPLQSAGITAGPDGNVWFTRPGVDIGRITPSGSVTEFSGGAVLPSDITRGPDGNLWFIEGSGIGRITPAGRVTNFRGGFFPGAAGVITAGRDGNLWVAEDHWAAVARVTPSGSCPRLHIESQLASVSKGTTTIVLQCAARRSACRGQLNLVYVPTDRLSTRDTIASADYSIRARHTARVLLRLNRLGRRLLAKRRNHQLAVIGIAPGTQRRVTLARRS